jgi:hypothetical protein
MMAIENPARFAEDLCQSGLEARHEIVYGPLGYLEGLDVGADFFPVWELLLPENRRALARLDFAAIKARRGPDWSVNPPHAHAAPVAVD